MSDIQEQQKKAVAIAALDYLPQGDEVVIGVGTGSTVNHFIAALVDRAATIDAAVASSEGTAQRLKALNIPVVDLNMVSQVPVYIDGADAVDTQSYCIKGGGGALTREKIIAAAADTFVCMVDASKQVAQLTDAFPLPVEVLPMARSYVARQLVAIGGNPVYRQDFVTDNGNIILDVYDLDFSQPLALEKELNQITGVVCHGLFASRPADVVLVATEDGVQKR